MVDLILRGAVLIEDLSGGWRWLPQGGVVNLHHPALYGQFEVLSRINYVCKELEVLPGRSGGVLWRLRPRIVDHNLVSVATKVFSRWKSQI